MTKLTKPTYRETMNVLDGTFCADRGRNLVACLSVGDVIVLRPKGRRASETLSLFDVYRYAIRCAANRKLLEKAREKKSRKQIRLANARQARAEKRLFNQ